MIRVLNPQVLQVDMWMRSTTPQIREQARALNELGKVRVDVVEAQHANLRVIEAENRVFHVSVYLDRQNINIGCTCSNRGFWSICRHRLAALLKLSEYLKEHPPSIWKAVMSQALAAPARHAGIHQGQIVFSLQLRATGWALAPYTIAARHLPHPVTREDELVELIDEHDLTVAARPLRSRITTSSYPNVAPEAIAAANMAIMLSQTPAYGYYGSGMSSLYEPVFALLPHCVVYYGAEADPLQRRITVVVEPGSLEVTIEARGEDMHLTTSVRHGDRIIAAQTGDVQVIIPDPLWMLVDNVLMPVRDSRNAAILLAEPELRIPQQEQTEFLEKYLLPLADTVPLRGDVVHVEEVEAQPQPRLYLSEANGELQAHLRFAYGAYEVEYERTPPPVSTRRKEGTTNIGRVHRVAETEHAAQQAVASYGLKRDTQPGRFLLRKSTHPIDFLMHQVPRIAEAGFEVFGEDALKTARVNRNRPTISFNVSSGIDWFDLNATVAFGDTEIALSDVRRAIKRREKYVKLADGSMGVIPEEWIERYRHLFALGEEIDGGMRLANNQLTLIDQLLGEADRAQVDAEFERRRERLRSFTSIAPQQLPPTFTGELRPYQKAAYDWLLFLREYGFGGCLADDMGLGKTVVTLAFIEQLFALDTEAPAVLVVVPRSLLFNWQREAARFTPELGVYVHADQGRIVDPSLFHEHELVVTTYGTMLRDIEILRQYEFSCIILDEAQAIKNPVAETSKAARLLKGRQRITLSGTPVENSTLELWSQFAFLNPGLLGNLDYFRDEFVTPIERKQEAAPAEFLRKMVYPFIMRRTKSQVAPELPPRTDRQIDCDMEPAQRRLYEKQRNYYRDMLLGMIDAEGVDDARMKILEGLLRLRQICCHPRLVEPGFRGNSGKFEQLFETLATLRAEGNRALVFSQFVQMLTLVRERLDAEKVPYAYLDGSTRNRQQVVDSFQRDDGPPFFLISLKAGGVGLNLTAADNVILIDPWWNPAVEMQATDRTHRIGQDKPVFVYRLVVRDSVEEKILELQSRKRALVDQLIAAEGSVFKSLTRDDIAALFS
jgi:non-specific serine/threonine protein kinase